MSIGRRWRRGDAGDSPHPIQPTAALGVRETEQVLTIIDELRTRGKTVVLISHDLEVVFHIADRIEVLRLGRVQGDIVASRSITIERGAQVSGNVRAPRVIINDGAHFDGAVEMEVDLPDGLRKAAR